MRKISSLIFASILGATIAIGAFKLLEKEPKQITIVEKENETPRQLTNMNSDSGVSDFTFAAEKTVNSVVHVFTETELEPMRNPWAEMFGYQNVDPQIQRGSGSGVIISKNGYIVTNNHVVAGAQRIQVNLNNNKTYIAEVIGLDPLTDLALLKIDEDKLPAITFGNSDDLKIGEWVLAVGNPFNLTSTVTAGIVSAKGRDIDILQSNYQTGMAAIESFIQTDAAVNPGNSGGALVNTNGELVGINSAIASTTGAFAGYSFAIPITIVQKVTKDLMDYGKVQRAFIGVRIANMNQEIADQIGKKDISGVFVSEAMKNGAANIAGMEGGDVITKIGNNPVKTVPDLQLALSKYSPGETVNITVWRDKSIVDLKLVLKNEKGNTDITNADEEVDFSTFGVEVEDISSNIKNTLNISGGVRISNLFGGKFKDAGIKQGFIVTKIDGKKIYDKEDFGRALNLSSGAVLIEGVYLDGTKGYFGVGL